jgi:hypothetical protein
MDNRERLVGEEENSPGTWFRVESGPIPGSQDQLTHERSRCQPSSGTKPGYEGSNSAKHNSLLSKYTIKFILVKLFPHAGHNVGPCFGLLLAWQDDNSMKTQALD